MEYAGLKDRVESVVGKEARTERQDTLKARRKARKSGKKFKKLKQKSPAKQLWASKYPWMDRPSTAKQAVGYTFVGAMAYEKLSQPVAKGSRPPTMFQDREWRSTILGGLQALAGAGVPGYTDVSHLKVPLAPGKKFDPELMQRAGNAKSLKAGAEAIRAEVIKHKLEPVAWNYRALWMIQPAVMSAQVRAAGAGVASAVVPMPWGLIPMAIGAQEGVHGAVLAKEVKGFTDKAAQGLEKAGVRNAVALAKEQARVVAAASEEKKAEAEVQAQEAGQQMARNVKIFMGVSLVAAAGGVVWWLRRRQHE